MRMKGGDDSHRATAVCEDGAEAENQCREETLQLQLKAQLSI